MDRITNAKLCLTLVMVFLPAIAPPETDVVAAGIECTYCPDFGETGYLQGRVTDADPHEFAVAVYIYVSGWWNKPWVEDRVTPINPDGTWYCNITPIAGDECATKVMAFLIPDDYDPPRAEGLWCLDSELYELPHCGVQYRYQTISWAGYDWWIKRHCNPVGPGPNYFCDSRRNVSVQDDYLCLAIAKQGGRWLCSEVILTESLGYGTYVFTVKDRNKDLDRNVVLGMFTWEDCVPEHSFREMDVEISRWGDPLYDNSQFVVQPWDTLGNLHRFDVDLCRTTTHVFTWTQNEVEFQSYYGRYRPQPGLEDMVASWSYTGPDVPPAGNENVRINFWLVNGMAPANGRQARVLIERFLYLPLTSVDP